jgi:hypothetical protein
MAVSKKKCKHCLSYEYAVNGIQTPGGFYCSVEHARLASKAKLHKASVDKLTKARQAQDKGSKAVRLRHRKEKESIKPKSKWLAEAQASFNKYIRARDYKDPCISCLKSRHEIESNQGWKVGGCWDAGHFMTRGAKGQLRFVLFNVHKQCKSCNGGGGRFSAKAATVDENYRMNLIKKIGINKVEFLENNNELDLKKGDIEYLKRVKKIFSKRANFYSKRI